MKAFVIAVSLACLVACSRGNIDTKEAVRQGVIDHLAGRKDLNVSAMNVEVASVTFKENEADATVSFSAKGGGGGGLTRRYTLERQGSRWVVKGGSDTGANPHGAMGTMPIGENPHGAMPPARGSLPEGGSLPPGHPAVPQK